METPKGAGYVSPHKGVGIVRKLASTGNDDRESRSPLSEIDN